jgi:cytochrome c oxidase subunit III
MDASLTAHHASGVWPRDDHYGDATPGKIGMWLFLVSDAFSFTGLLLAYGILRAGSTVWQQPGEPALNLPFTAGLTALLIGTSFTNVMGFVAAEAGRRRQAMWLLGATALGGALFLLGQMKEWFGLGGRGLVAEGLVLGHSARASTFYLITGFHGLHVLIGVLYILAILVSYARGRAGAREVELLSLFWCFVDFVWVFVFSFVYLMA